MGHHRVAWLLDVTVDYRYALILPTKLFFYCCCRSWSCDFCLSGRNTSSSSII